jgi:hypothetical protein
MSMLPWANWIYHNDYRKQEVETLQQEATSVATFYNSEIDNFKQYYSSYKDLVLLNSALAIISQSISMDDEQYDNLTSTLNSLENITPEIDSNVEQIIDAVVLWPKFIKCVYNMGSLLKSKVFSTDSSEVAEEGLSDLAESSEEVGIEVASTEQATALTAETIGEDVGESAAEAVLEGAALSTWEAFGIGVVVAVGIDAVFGIINGEKEKEELDNDIDKLKSALSKLMFAQNTLSQKVMKVESGIVTEENRYNGIIASLNKTTGDQQEFTLDIEASVENADQFISKGGNAISHFSTYVNFKYYWYQALQNNADLTKNEFFDLFNAFSSQPLSDDELDQYWQTLSQYSSSMQASEKQAAA